MSLNQQTTGGSYGIFVVSADSSNGKWQYTTNGSTSFTDFTLTTNNGLLLGPPSVNVGVKFNPNPNYYGKATIVFGLYDLDMIPFTEVKITSIGARNDINGKFSLKNQDYYVTQSILPYIPPNFPMELYFDSFSQSDSTALAALRQGDLSKSAGAYLTNLKQQYLLNYILEQKAVDPNNTYTFKDESELAMYKVALNDLYFLHNRASS